MSVLLERRDGVGVITIDRPERRNSLTIDMSAQLVEHVAVCEDDDGVSAIIVTGTPPAFCAGADLTALEEAREEGLRAIYAGFLAFANSSLPTIAAVNGAAVGAGLNLALACDVRLVSIDARFDARFLQLGLHPGGGMTWMLQRLVGPQTAAAMTLFGRILDGDEAIEMGLAVDMYEDVVDAAVEFAQPAVKAPRDLVVTTKRTLRTTAAYDRHDDAVEAELVAQVASMESPAFTELLAAMRARISRQA
jgi:enoyl-CoA hydratase